MALTNDEYHDILDAIKAAKADFRYSSDNGDGTAFEVEAYQISPRSRFENAEWPPWLKMQTSPSEVNKLYCEANSPNDLTLMMVGGVEQPLGASDWIILYKNGDMTVVPASDFAQFSKTVPVPDKPVIGEELAGFEEKYELDENNKLIPRKTPLTVVPTIIEEATDLAAANKDQDLEDDVCAAIGMLQGEAPENALDTLMASMLSRVTWCDCNPGRCKGGDILGCRQNSPLVK